MIRKLQKSDREQLIKLFWEFTKNSQKNFIAEDLGEFHQYKDQEVTYNKDADDYCAGKLVVFVVEEGDKLVGYSAAKITEKPERVLDKEAYIEDWFVEENYQGRGIGEKLFDVLLEELKKMGCTHVRLDAFTTNQKVIDIYHKYGFIDNTIEMYKKL